MIEDKATHQAMPARASAPHADQPLDLTVHSLSVPSQPPQTHAGRWKMLAVLLVCAAPVLASYLTYYVIRPQGRHSFGELISPQRPLPAMTTRSLSGQVGDLRALKDQWLLITVAGGACDTACEHNLYFQRQLRESLGKDKKRLDRVWLVPDDVPVRPALLPALAQAHVLRVPPAALAQWLSPAPGQQLQDHLYVVDPLGNWMMRFPAAMDVAAAAKAKRDLERLLRASSSWDREGRPAPQPVMTP